MFLPETRIGISNRDVNFVSSFLGTDHFINQLPSVTTPRESSRMHSAISLPLAPVCSVFDVDGIFNTQVCDEEISLTDPVGDVLGLVTFRLHGHTATIDANINNELIPFKNIYIHGSALFGSEYEKNLGCNFEIFWLKW